MQNGHPLVVHFPIALLTVAVFAAFLAAFTARPSVQAFARACLYLGTAGAAAAVISGFFASQTVAPVLRAAHELEEHRNYGYMVLILASLLSAWSVVAWRRLKRPPRPHPLFLLGHAALLFALFMAGLEGGEMVYEHGLGTKLTAPGGPLHEPLGDGDAPGDSVPTARDFR
ncbi:MAG: DUF2231 domain-containing protein [Candidatus Eiseniibacteriota bacterium]